MQKEADPNHRTKRISDVDHLLEEKTHLTGAVERNGYNSNSINKIFRKPEKHLETLKAKYSKHKAFLPYVNVAQKKLAICWGYMRSVSTTYKAGKPIKVRILFNTEGIYNIPCTCEMIFLCQTSRLISIIYMDSRTCQLHDELTSWKVAVVEHSVIANHIINFKEASVIRSTDRTRFIMPEWSYKL